MNTKNRLIVFAGKPGVGKSSIIERISHGWTVIDVWHFMVPHIKTGEVPPEEKNILAYQMMYEYVAEIDASRLILELGTNCPVVNVAGLLRLINRYEIDVLLCEAPVELCRERLQARGYRVSGDGIDRRLARDFPNIFLSELRGTPLRHHLINTEGNIDEVSQRIKKQFLLC